jgi:predicted RNA-binding Zn-ribbon protein involved in translation (DUF1610 family)
MSGPSAAAPIGRAPDGSLVRAADAEPGVVYHCPGCSSELLLRRGEIRRPHFAHRGGEGCAPESTLHRAAKERLTRVVVEWTSGDGPRPCIARACPRSTCDGGIVQDLPENITHAAEEVRLPGGQIADVVLFRGDEPAVAIEVFVTHAVDAVKASEFTIPWMEIRAEDALDRPYWWVVSQDGLRPFDCPACGRRARDWGTEVAEIQARAAAVAARLGTTLAPTPPYHAVPQTCWRCGIETVVYLWPGGGDYSTKRPPHPIPDTLELRVTEGYGGAYWVNACFRCGAPQGDGFLRSRNGDYFRIWSGMQGYLES